MTPVNFFTRLALHLGTRFVLIVVEGLGFVGALVERVGDAITVVVGIGTAVLILEAIEVLGLVGALVERVGDAIVVVIGSGQPSSSWKPSLSSGSLGHLSSVSGMPSWSLSGSDSRRHPGSRPCPGLVGALVNGIGDAVTVAIGPGPRSMIFSLW